MVSSQLFYDFFMPVSILLRMKPRQMVDFRQILVMDHDRQSRLVLRADAGADDCLENRSIWPNCSPGFERSCGDCTRPLQGVRNRCNWTASKSISVTRRVISRGHQVNLEFSLLHYLINNPNIPIPHIRLVLSVWGPEHGSQIEYLRVFVSGLRKKIEPDPAHPRYLVTEPWIGYRFDLPIQERANS